MFRESWIVYGISYIVYRRDAKFCVSTIIATIATITIITIIITISTNTTITTIPAIRG